MCEHGLTVIPYIFVELYRSKTYGYDIYGSQQRRYRDGWTA